MWCGSVSRQIYAMESVFRQIHATERVFSQIHATERVFWQIHTPECGSPTIQLSCEKNKMMSLNGSFTKLTSIINNPVRYFGTREIGLFCNCSLWISSSLGFTYRVNQKSYSPLVVFRLLVLNAFIKTQNTFSWTLNTFGFASCV